MNAASRPLRVLYVEDHADTLQAISRLLQGHGFDVVCADCCRAALEAAATPEVWFDLLIADVQLPDGLGWDLLRQVRQRYPIIRGIVLSAHGNAADVAASAAAGFERHLTKPVSFDQLLDAVNDVTAGFRDTAAPVPAARGGAG